jgi:hypothetical protein
MVGGGCHARGYNCSGRGSPGPRAG